MAPCPGGERRRPRRTPDPFARDEAAPPARKARERRSMTFTWSAVDSSVSAETRSCWPSTATAVRWTGRSPQPAGAINPKLWIGPDRVVLQVQNPNQLVVLETDSGRLVARGALAEGESLERRPCRSTRTTSCSCRTDARSRSST